MPKIIIHILLRIGAWLAAAIIAALMGVIIQTQNVIGRLRNLGADIAFGERISMTVYDINHLGSLYSPIIAATFAIAFLVGGIIYHFTKFGRRIIYAVAGGTAILVMLFAMKEAFFDVHLIAGARDAFGITLQVLAGTLGGWVFAHLTRNLVKTKTA